MTIKTIGMFTKGQKVQCTYYHEYRNMEMSYRRTWLSKLIDKPFTPVKLGIIVGDAGVHPFWLARGGTEQYMLVKFKEYYFAKPIPVSCIEDAAQSAEKIKAMLAKDIDSVGKKGYDMTSYLALQDMADKALKFVGLL